MCFARRPTDGAVFERIAFFSMYLYHRRDNYVAGNTYNTLADTRRDAMEETGAVYC